MWAVHELLQLGHEEVLECQWLRPLEVVDAPQLPWPPVVLEEPHLRHVRWDGEHELRLPEDRELLLEPPLSRPRLELQER